MGKRTRGNGQGTVFKMQNGKWRVEKTLGWDGNKRIVHTKSGFKLKKDATAYLESYNSGALKVESSVTFKALYDMWFEAHVKKLSQDQIYVHESAFSKCKASHYKTFANLKSSDWQKHIDECDQSRRSKQAIKAMLTGLYKFAMQNDYCDKNYASFITLPPKEKSKKDAFTQEEINDLWKAYEGGDEFIGHVLIMIYTGMRPGEYIPLTKDHIDFKRQCITDAGIKTNESKIGEIPIADCILSIVQSLSDKTDSRLYSFGEKKFREQYKESLNEHKIRLLNPHCCRHTTATALALKGVPPAIIQAIMRHTDYSTTMQYTHVQKLDVMLDAVNRLKEVKCEKTKIQKTKQPTTKK